MWKKIKLPYITERIIAFSLPKDGQMLVLDMDGAYIVDIQKAKVQEVQSGNSWLVTQYFDAGKARSDFDSAIALEYSSKQFVMLGLFGGENIEINKSGEQIKLHTETYREGERCFSVERDGTLIFEYCFKDLSGDWLHLTFSEDGACIVLGNPYELSLFQRIE